MREEFQQPAPLQRVMIIGGAGSGKSTVARQLGQATGLPVIHIDPLYWLPDWRMREPEETVHLVREAAQAEQWIFDGNNASTFKDRLARADALVFLDIQTGVRLWRVIKRTILNLGRVRPDMAEGCPERLDWNYLKFLTWVVGYSWRRTGRLRALKLLQEAPDNIKIVHLKSAAQAKGFLSGQDAVRLSSALLIATFVFILACGAARAAESAANVAPPATLYFPVLPTDAPPEATPQLVPIAANHDLQQLHAGLTRAVIVVHDETRDATGALAVMSALAGTANGSILILAPQFLLASDIDRFAAHLPEQGKSFAHWSITGWPSGDNADAVSPAKGVSSFTVVDLLLMFLSDRSTFPDLKQIVIAGSGAGGNFVQRYAAFGVAPDLLDARNLPVRFVVANAASYLYLTANRPQTGKQGFGPSDTASCPDVNAYPYGLERLNDYTRHVGANAVKIRYATRYITYLAAKAAPDSNPDAFCAALAQGSGRAARLDHYAYYLHALFGDVAARTQTFAALADGKADQAALFGSTCGMASLFGDGVCLTGLERAAR